MNTLKQMIAHQPELELLFEKFRLMANHSDQYYEIQQKEDYLKNLEYDFVTAKTISEREAIYIEYLEVEKELNNLKLGVF